MIPVILDTDLGTDIDDHWAVAMILGCPELDVRLITTASGDTSYRAQLLAGLLTAAGRTDIPIGIGVPAPLLPGVPLLMIPDGAAATPIASYEGTVLDDGVQAFIDTIMSSADPVTVIAIGPVTNLGAALARQPAITARSRVIAMAADLRGGIRVPDLGPQKEYNVIVDVTAFRALLDSTWDLTLSPVDSCGLIDLEGERYARLRDSSTRLLKVIMRDCREWYEQIRRLAPTVAHPDQRTSTLFDTLAVYLAYADDAVVIEDAKLVMDDAGVVAEAADGRSARVALLWRDLDAFLDHLVERIETAALAGG